MNKIDALKEEFKFKYERFFIGCDAIEELDKWDKEEYGEMEGFYQNDIVSVILRIIVADGEISQEEVEYLNEFFGFKYTKDELIDVYQSCHDDISHSFDEQFENGISLLSSINGKLADAYKELLGLICDIIIESDDFISSGEKEEVQKLKELL